MASGEAHFGGNVFHSQVVEASVLQHVLCFVEAHPGNEGRVVLLEAQTDDGADVAHIDVDVFGQQFCRVARVAILLFDHQLCDDFPSHLFHESGRDSVPVRSLLGFLGLFRDVVLSHNVIYK